MGLAAPQARLLTLTSRKADCELGLSIDANEKMALSREQSDLTAQYFSLLNAKNICYYANGKYNDITYQYLMGYNNFNSNFGSLMTRSATAQKAQMDLKKDNSMVLADANGRIVMSDMYGKALQQVLGSGCIDSSGHGKTFSMDEIPAIIAAVCALSGQSGITEDEISAVIENRKVTTSFGVTPTNNLTGEEDESFVKESTHATDLIQAIVDLYYPIFVAAAANGWTTEYNKDMARNSEYLNDAIVTGFFQLQQVNEYGAYEPDVSLTYFCTQESVTDRQDSEQREKATAWLNKEKARIAEKESYLDADITDLSTELEAINTEIESVKSFIDDEIQSTMDFGNA